MSKFYGRFKPNNKLEAQIVAYFTKTIIGEGKNYRKMYLKRIEKEDLNGDFSQFKDESFDQSYFMQDRITKETMLFEEQMFENLFLYLAFKDLRRIHKEVLLYKFACEFSEPFIAKFEGVSKQAIGKRRKSAYEILVANYFKNKKENANEKFSKTPKKYKLIKH
jgi:hypothetical protein